MELREIKTASELIYDGVILHVYKDTVTLPNGAPGVRESIRHIGAVGIVALTDDGRVLLEHQFRYPVDRVITEIPAGKLDSRGEDRLAAAQRELAEETGYTARKWTPLGDYMPAAAYSDEIITLFLAEGLERGSQRFDEDEFLEVFSMPLADAAKACLDGTITDGKTVAGILRAYYGK